MKPRAASKILRREAGKHTPSDPKKLMKFKIALRMEATRKLKPKNLLLAA